MHYQASVLHSSAGFANYELIFAENIVYNQTFEGNQSSLITHSSMGTIQLLSNFFFDIGYLKNDSSLPANQVLVSTGGSSQESLFKDFGMVEGPYSSSQRTGVLTLECKGLGDFQRVNLIRGNHFRKIYASSAAVVHYKAVNYD